MWLEVSLCITIHLDPDLLVHVYKFGLMHVQDARPRRRRRLYPKVTCGDLGTGHRRRKVPWTGTGCRQIGIPGIPNGIVMLPTIT